MSQLVADARFALRGMWKRKALSALLVVTLALGLAANAVIFNVLDVLVLRPFDFPELPRLVRLWETHPSFDGVDRSNGAPANVLDWRAQSAGVLQDVVAMEWWNANLRAAGSAERVQGHFVSPVFFEALGVRPALGRAFLAEEGLPGRNHRVVLGHELWQRSFGGEASLVGRSVMLDGEPYEVVGIAPPGFAFPEGTEAWAPMVTPAAAEARRDQHWLSVFGRLAPGRSRAEARAALALVAARLDRDHPQTNKDRRVEVSGFSYGFGDPVLPQLLGIWQAAAVLVLLIACVNVANLVLARGAERRRELALRLALGAGRSRLLSQLTTEGLVASLAAVAVSLPLAWLGSRAIHDAMPAEIARFLPGWERLGPDWRTLLFSMALAVVATAVFSIVPALRATRPDLVEALRDGGRAVTAGAGRQRGRNLLVVGQLATALALLACAGFAVRSAQGLLRGPQGFDPDGLLTFTVSLSEARYPNAPAQRAFAREAEARLAELPGVEQLALTSALPASGYSNSRGVEIDGRPLPEGREPAQVDARWVSPGYFETLRLPLLAGRGIEARDDETAPGVAVISRSMAERFWPGDDPLGRRFRIVGKDMPWLTVVGVSGDVIHHWVMRRNSPTFYRPLRQEPRGMLSVALRTSGDPDALAASARGALTALDPDQPAYNVKSMRRAIETSTIGMQFVAKIMAAFGVLALVLAVSGVYGVMSYRVSLRTLEIGVRVALGASRLDVLRLTLGQALRLSGLGLAIGMALALAAGRVLSSALRGAVALDPAVLAWLTAALAACALVAAWLPARRALAVDPMIALRSE